MGEIHFTKGANIDREKTDSLSGDTVVLQDRQDNADATKEAVKDTVGFNRHDRWVGIKQNSKTLSVSVGNTHFRIKLPKAGKVSQVIFADANADNMTDIVVRFATGVDILYSQQSRSRDGLGGSTCGPLKYRLFLERESGSWGFVRKQDCNGTEESFQIKRPFLGHDVEWEDLPTDDCTELQKLIRQNKQEGRLVREAQRPNPLGIPYKPDNPDRPELGYIKCDY